MLLINFSVLFHRQVSSADRLHILQFEKVYEAYLHIV